MVRLFFGILRVYVNNIFLLLNIIKDVFDITMIPLGHFNNEFDI
jgi:hypothetical protein